MKKKFFYGIGIMSLMFAATSCGGGEEEATDETAETTEETVEEVVEPVNYTVDVENSVINWTSYDGEEVGHTGTVKLLDGSYTTEGDMVTAASLNVDMNTITADAEKLQGHLMAPDFFDVNQYASASFSFDRHEEGVIYGTVNASGMEFAVEAPATVGEGSVEISDFKIDLGQLAFFVTEREEAPEEEWHDTNIGFTASIMASVAE
jgi:polyisoprenoid-binding protein YceI